MDNKDLENEIAKIKEMFQNAIISDEKMNVKIVSYCLSTIFNKLKLQKNNEIKKCFVYVRKYECPYIYT